MNVLDEAIARNLSDDEVLQAVAEIHIWSDTPNVLDGYPTYVHDVAAIIDYDTALAMDSLDEVVHGSLSDRYSEIVAALERCGLDAEADVVKRAKSLSEKDEEAYWADESLSDGCALYDGDKYEAFWDKVREYIGNERDR